MTDLEKRANDVKVKVKFRSISQQVNVCKTYNSDIIKICGHSEVETLQANLSETMDLSNEIACEYEATKDLEKKVNKSANCLYIKNLNIEPYSPVGEDCFIEYKVFIDEFKMYILSRASGSVEHLTDPEPGKFRIAHR